MVTVPINSYRENTVSTSVHLYEYYDYDKLNRLTTFHRGELDGGVISVANRDYGEEWTLSATGNWTEFMIDHDGDDDYDSADDLDQDRTHNDANEIYNATPANAITEQSDPQQSQWATPLYSARGNMTTIPQPNDLENTFACTYDAWHRLVEVKDGANVVAKYEYDGLGRRVKAHVDTDETPGVDTYRHFFYNVGWQILETRTTATEADEPEDLYPEYQYMWSARYIDSPVLRDENKDADDECFDESDERLYYLTDANMNVTCLVDDAGDAMERYVYDAYGKVTIYDDDWSITVTWANSKKNEVLYAGYRYDPESGLFHVRHRMHHPTLGRSIQRDPIGYADGMSLYEYAASRVCIARDAWGLDYTYEDVKTHINSQGEARTRYLLAKLEAEGVTLAVENYFWGFYNYDGGDDYVDIDCDASSVAEAADWFEDGMREWAYHNRSGTFRDIVRVYAKDLKQKGKDTVEVLAETYDFVHKWTEYASGDPSSQMMDAEDVGSLTIWVFAGRSLFRGATTAKVDVQDHGEMSKFFYDMKGGKLNTDDQTHHFAAYFTLGANVSSPQVIGGGAAFVTADTPHTNPGDYLLAVVALNLGESYKDGPRYMGPEIREVLHTDPTKRRGTIPNTQWNAAIHNAGIIIAGE